MNETVKAIASLINGQVVGDPNIIIEGVSNIRNPIKNTVTFIENSKHLQQVATSEVGCIIVPQDTDAGNVSKTLITCSSPKLSFAKVMNLFHPSHTFSGTVSEKAFVADSARIAEGVTIEPFAVIEDGVVIGEKSTIRSFSYIDRNTIIGEHVVIHPNVMIYHDIHIGSRVIIHSSTVIGADGFGYVRDHEGNQTKIPQIGNVIIEDDVEIGSNVSIDRATFGSTIIKKGVKIDNLVQIAHNVVVGDETAISGLSGVAGSTVIGKNCILAAQVGIADHCIIEDNVILGGQCGVPSKKKIPSGQVFLGSPARPIENFIKQQGIQSKLPRLLQEVKELKIKVKELESKLPNG